MSITQHAQNAIQKLNLPVFPLKRNAKIPKTRNGFKDAKMDVSGIANNDNYGIAPPDGYVIIDVDNAEALTRARVNPHWSEETFTVKTPRGWHFYWRTEWDVGDQKAGNSLLGKGVDTRIGGLGYVVGPGSCINGETYEIINDKDIEKLSFDLARVIRIKAETNGHVEIKRKKAPANEVSIKGKQIEQGQRNDQLTKYAGSMIGTTNASSEAVLQALSEINGKLCNPPLPDKELQSIVNSIIKAAGERDDRGSFVHKGLSDREWVSSCLEQMGISLRYNTLAQAVEYFENKWIKINDPIEAILLSRIQEECILAPRIGKDNKLVGMTNIKMPKVVFRDGRLAISWEKQVDPFLEYIKGLPAWDGEKRIAKLPNKMFKVESDMDLARFSTVSVMVAAIDLSANPGSKNDIMCVFIGPQGLGKSIFWRKLLPKDEWFGDSLDFSDPEQKRVEALLNKKLVENSEMLGSKKQEIERNKAFLSRNSDHLRLPYRHNPEDIPRRAVIVGTSNEDDCLPNDKSGNRRFIPVVLSKRKSVAKISDYLDEYRDALWAEALHLFNKGTKHWIHNNKLAMAQREQTEKHRHRDEVLEEYLEVWCDSLGHNQTHFTMSEVIQGAKIPDGHRWQQYIGGWLKKNGFYKDRISGSRAWVKPTPPEHLD